MLNSIDIFTCAYIETALWSTNDNSDPETGGNPLDDNYSISDLDPETLIKIKADCEKFQRENASDLHYAAEAGVKCGPDFDETGRAGHDFWLTRNGHGCGFWDGDWPEPFATTLTAAAKAFGPVDLYVGDDGKLHI